jgi:hypothetical protein
MTAHDAGVRLGLLLVAAAALTFVGCSAPTESLDEREREHPMLKAALERERAGDEKAAIESYRDLIARMPDMARPHLALAFLLDKPGRDPVKAVYHYQRYLELRPDTEKHDMIATRIRQAKIQVISDVFPSVSNLAERLLAVEQENGLLRVRVTNLTTQLEYQKAITEKLRAQAAALEAAEREAVERLAAPEAGMQPGLRTVRVESGDSLIRIATRVYGDPSRWRSILEANRNVLRNKDDLRAGQLLVLP